MSTPTTNPRQRWRLTDNEYKRGSNTYPGNHFCDESLVVPMKPAWPKPRAGKPPYTWIRIVPGFSPDDPTQPDVTRLEDGELGEFIRCYPAFRAGGMKKQITFLCGNKQTDPDFDIWETPPKILYTAIYRAVEKNQEKPEWEFLLKRHRDEEGNMRGAVVVPVRDMYFAQCVMYQNGEADIDPAVPWGLGDTPETNKLCLLDLGSQAGRALVDLLRAQHEVAGGGFDYTLLDPIGLDSEYAKFFCFYSLDIGPPAVASARGTGGRRSAAPPAVSKGQDNGFGYGISVFSEFGTESPVYSKDEQELIMSRMQQWEDVLQFPSIERQAELLRGVIPWDVLEYAWQDHPEWLPADCPEAEAARGRVTSGYVPAADAGDTEVPTTGSIGGGQRTRRAATAEPQGDQPSTAARRTRRDTETDTTVRGRALPDEPQPGEVATPRTRTRERATEAADALQRARERMRG